MKWTGLTGGIGTGKSTARKLLQSLGFQAIDADEISHRLSQPGEQAYSQIVSHFGNSILEQDQRLNRKKLGELVFSQPQQKAVLEGILHPLIQKEVQTQRRVLESKGEKICFYDVPLLFEKNLVSQFDHTVLIWCDPKTQLQRLLERDKIPPLQIEYRIKNQWPIIDKVKLAEFCIDNSGDLEDLSRQLKKLVNKII